MKKVLVVGNSTNIHKLFKDRGYGIVYEANTTQVPDLVCFTGGADVDPRWYGEAKHFKTQTHPSRDAKELVFYERHLDRPKIGICRGGQFLNVMSGGALWQDVDGHVNSTNSHPTIDLLFTKDKIELPSGHHQMMIPTKEAHVLAVAHEAKTFLSMTGGRERPKYDPEVVWYPKSNSLCYQSHPEWKLKSGDRKHQDYFFDLISWAFDL
jgi:hypothetical protein